MNRNRYLAPSLSPAGFTLVELMVTLAILAILATIGMPSFQALIADYRVSAQANSVQGLLQFARSEAVKRRQDVTVCLNAEGNLEVLVGFCDNDSDPLRVLPLDGRVTFAGFNTEGITYVPSGFLTDSPPPLTFSADMASNRAICIMKSGFSEISLECGS